MRISPCTLLLAALTAGQLAGQTQQELRAQTAALKTAIRDNELTRAVDIATELDAKVQAGRRAWLVRDAGERLGEVLSWLPPAMDSLWVNQVPFQINGQDSLMLLADDYVRAYSIDRLVAQNNGKSFQALNGATIRLAVAAAQTLPYGKSTSMGIPSAMDAEDVVYFYFLAGPANLQSHDLSIEGMPVWQTAGMIDSGLPFEPGVQRTKREDPNWLAMPRPNLLVLTNRKEALQGILGRLAHGSNTRAFPAALPEWKHVNLAASAWGIRHYAQTSKPAAGTRGCESFNLPAPNCGATGVAFQFDWGTQKLEIHYLTSLQLQAKGFREDDLRRQFQMDNEQPGGWRLVSDLKDRGQWPMAFAFTMLGFGGYK